MDEQLTESVVLLRLPLCLKNLLNLLVGFISLESFSFRVLLILNLLTCDFDMVAVVVLSMLDLQIDRLNTEHQRDGYEGDDQQSR